jgi:hypothetical protein
MNPAIRNLSSGALCCLLWGTAAAQQQSSPPAATPPAKPPAATAQSEAGEPRADTSRPAPAEATPPAPPPAAAPGPGRTPAPARAAVPARGPAAAPGASKIDRLDLGTATVTGSQEQPKVMYIVPWKKSDIGDLAGKPMNSLVDEILAPVDRDVFKREVVYYQAVQADASQNGAPPKPAQQGEK